MSESEHGRWDPKDGELCVPRAKPGETLVEARSDSDVQNDGKKRISPICLILSARRWLLKRHG